MYRITLFLISLLFYSCSKDNNVFCESMIRIEKFPEEKTSRGKLMVDTLYFTYNIFSFEDNVISINQKKLNICSKFLIINSRKSSLNLATSVGHEMISIIIFFCTIIIKIVTIIQSYGLAMIHKVKLKR